MGERPSEPTAPARGVFKAQVGDLRAEAEFIDQRGCKRRTQRPGQSATDGVAVAVGRAGKRRFAFVDEIAEVAHVAVIVGRFEMVFVRQPVVEPDGDLIAVRFELRVETIAARVGALARRDRPERRARARVRRLDRRVRHDLPLLIPDHAFDPPAHRLRADRNREDRQPEPEPSPCHFALRFCC